MWFHHAIRQQMALLLQVWLVHRGAPTWSQGKCTQVHFRRHSRSRVTNMSTWSIGVLQIGLEMLAKSATVFKQTTSEIAPGRNSRETARMCWWGWAGAGPPLTRIQNIPLQKRSKGHSYVVGGATRTQTTSPAAEPKAPGSCVYCWAFPNLCIQELCGMNLIWGVTWSHGGPDLLLRENGERKKKTSQIWKRQCNYSALLCCDTSVFFTGVDARERLEFIWRRKIFFWVELEFGFKVIWMEWRRNRAVIFRYETRCFIEPFGKMCHVWDLLLD